MLMLACRRFLDRPHLHLDSDALHQRANIANRSYSRLDHLYRESSWVFNHCSRNESVKPVLKSGARVAKYTVTTVPRAKTRKREQVQIRSLCGFLEGKLSGKVVVRHCCANEADKCRPESLRG